MVWDLFANREAITMEMSQLVGESVRPIASQEDLEAKVRVPASEKKGFFHRCAECGSRIVPGGFSEGDARYCSMACYTAGPFPGFCQECEASTTDDAPGSTSTYNGIGATLRAGGRRCATCHSMPAKKWVIVLFLPVIPLKPYRIRWVNRRAYVGRGMRRG
jgi:hypothetical protein